MLGFMRKHQKYFYVIITFVIVISFSFFGTYSTLAGNSIHEQVAFTTLEGQEVTRGELEEMAIFLGTDNEDKKLFGGMWGPNFLNDGVIRKNFLESGLASILISAYPEPIEEDLLHRFPREKSYVPYTHPQAKFLSSVNAWAYFAPPILANLEMLQNAKNPISPDAIDARINLFLIERRFPSPILRQILRGQERQSGNIQHDEALDYQDLSLFGYHTLEDWFGPHFTRLISQFIFNSAALAEAKGYVVGREEALLDLMKNAERSFQENQGSPQLVSANSQDYFEEQLQRMRLDRTKAVRIWQKVLLFRRLFNDVSQSVFVDSSTYKTFNHFASEVVTGDLFRLPDALKFSDFRTLQRFETYLDAITKRTKEEKGNLSLPKTLLPASEIAKKAPELVQKRYKLEIQTASKKNLAAKVGMKETLAFQLDEKNWNSLKKQFPELGLKEAKSSEEKLTVLDSLDNVARGRLDKFTREQIVAANPKWIDAALADAPVKEQEIKLSAKGSHPSFPGLDKGESLIKLLDQGGSDLPKVTFDDENFYHIKVLERGKAPEVLTFGEALKEGILDKMLDENLDVFFVQLRSKNPALYQNKNLKDVQNEVAVEYFAKVLEGIKSSLKGLDDHALYDNLTGERLAPYRFLAIGNELIKEAPKNSSLIITEEDLNKEGLHFENQFKWVKSPLELSRRGEESLKDGQELFTKAPGTWTKVKPSPNGDLYFAFVREVGPSNSEKEVQQNQIAKARFLLGNDAAKGYLNSMLPLLKENHAISFEYIHASETTVGPGGEG